MEEQYFQNLYKQSIQEMDEKLREKWMQEWKEYVQERDEKKAKEWKKKRHHSVVIDWSSLVPNPKVTMETLKEKPININWHWERDQYLLNKHLLKKHQEWFFKSDLKRELMEKLWHPCNMKKWHGWGFEDDDQETEWDWVNQW